MGIETKERGQTVRLSLFRAAILLPQSHNQIGEWLKGQPIGPELHMPRLMSRHDQIQTRIFFSCGIAAEERWQRNGAPVLAHRRPRNSLLAQRIGKRLNRHVRATEPLDEELHGPGHLPERHTAQGCLHRRQGLLRLQGEIGPGPFDAVGQDFHPGCEPGFETGLRLGRFADQAYQFRRAPQIGQCRLRITLCQQGAILQDFEPPCLIRHDTQQAGRLRQPGDASSGIPLRQQRSNRDHLGPHRLVFEIAEDERTGAEKFDGPEIVRLAETVLRNELQSERHPGPGLLKRQHAGDRRNLTDVLQRHDEIDLGQFEPDLQPGTELIRRDNRHHLRRDAEKF